MYDKNKQWDADTGNYAKWIKENEGVDYFLLHIDIFYPLCMDSPFITLQGKEMEKVLEDLFEAAQTNIFRMDGGPEFNNKWVKSLLKNRNIK